MLSRCPLPRFIEFIAYIKGRGRLNKKKRETQRRKKKEKGGITEVTMTYSMWGPKGEVGT